MIPVEIWRHHIEQWNGTESMTRVLHDAR